MEMPFPSYSSRALSRFILLMITTVYSLSPSTSSADETQEGAHDSQRHDQFLESRLPAPPDAFVWRIRRGVAFPKPEGWNEKQRSLESGDLPVLVYAASPESFSTTTMFETGFTLQVISDPMKLEGVKATDMAIGALAPFVKSHDTEDVLVFDRSSHGDFDTIIYRFRDAPGDLEPIIVHKFVLANNELDRLYIFTFESPEETWQESWRDFGTPILSGIKAAGVR